jgi:putative dimethyl sulfoxide reductase chaperone
MTSADVFRLLASCFYQPERDIFLEERLGENLLEAVQSAFPHAEPLARQLADALRASRQEDLLVDYARLFLGPFEIFSHPYGSVYLDGEKVVMGNSTVAVKGFYAEQGLGLEDDFHELPDHIAVELEFLFLLNFREDEARKIADAEATTKAIEVRRQFLSQHLGRWIVPFTKRMQEHAGTDFYRLLAALCAQCVTAQMVPGLD